MAGRFEGKQALVLGVANKRSIAWAIAERLAAEGVQLAFTYQGERIEKSVRDLAATVDTKLVTECDVRSDSDLDRVFARDCRRIRRRARRARPLGRVRGCRGSRGPVHRHAARPLLDGSRHQRVLARRVRPPRRAADGGARRRLDRDDDVPGRRARGAALQRDGRREGDARRVRCATSPGISVRTGSASTRSPPVRCARWRPARSRASRRWRRCSSSVRRCAATSSAADCGAAAAYLLSDDAKNVSGTTLYVDAGYHAMGM